MTHMEHVCFWTGLQFVVCVQNFAAALGVDAQHLLCMYDGIDVDVIIHLFLHHPVSRLGGRRSKSAVSIREGERYVLTYGCWARGWLRCLSAFQCLGMERDPKRMLL